MPSMTDKQKQFNDAMTAYETRAHYQRIDMAVSIANITLQGFLLYQVVMLPIGFWQHFVAFALAYLATDFINGLIHMHMDSNENYTSLAGPFIAKFHLHHRTPRYKNRPLIAVYFNETGSKIWLVPYLAAVALLSRSPEINAVLLCIFVYIGILSSVAEVSHYLCHNSQAPAALFLMRIGILLPKRHHARHHLEDNVNYAFLNGMTDPLVNFIARRLHLGYKTSTDLHYALYDGGDSANR